MRVHSPFQKALILPLADPTFQTYHWANPLVNVGDLESITTALRGELRHLTEGTLVSQLPHPINGNDAAGKGSLPHLW